MSESASLSNTQAKAAQTRNVRWLVGIIIGGVVFVMVSYLWKLKTHRNAERAVNETAVVSVISKELEDSSLGLQRLERRLAEYDQELQQYRLQDAQRQAAQKVSEEEPLTTEINELKQRLSLLEQPSVGLEAVVRPEERVHSSSAQAAYPNVFPEVDLEPSFSTAQPVPMPPMSKVQAIQIETLRSNAGEPIKTANNYIPAGTYVEALLLQGIDASAALSSPTDPRPVLMRLIANGSLPNEVSTHIEDCRLIGAAYGDISSERAFIRLETMSCTLKSHAIIEMAVDGYVTGEDGKVGLRGTVVRREQALLTNSFISGLASGIGSGTADTFGKESISPLGIVRETTGTEVFKQGLSKGTGTALDRISRYYIDRAEQFQPVIQIAAGRKIEIVFKKGFYLHLGKKTLALAQDQGK